jgi:hypothetical protein
MNISVRIGRDTSKSVFQLHGVDENEVVVVRRQFRRAEMIRYFERLPPVLVAIGWAARSWSGRKKSAIGWPDLFQVFPSENFGRRRRMIFTLTELTATVRGSLCVVLSAGNQDSRSLAALPFGAQS